MKLFTYIAHGMILVATVAVILAIIFFRTKTPQEQAQFFYELHNQFPFGSKEEAWILDKTIELDSTFDMAYRAKSIRYTRLGLLEEGMKYLNQAVDLNPVDHLGYRAYFKLFTLHDYRGAISDLVRLDPLTPDFRDAPWGHDIDFLLGLAYQGLGDYEKAFQYIDQSIMAASKERSEEWVDVEIFLYRGILQWKLNQQEGAIQDFEKAIQYYDKFTEAYYYKSLVEHEMGNLSEAVSSIQLAKQYFQQGYRELHPYYQLPFQVELADIEEALNEIVMISANRGELAESL